jgi:hypothetical protein
LELRDVVMRFGDKMPVLKIEPKNDEHLAIHEGHRSAASRNLGV